MAERIVRAKQIRVRDVWPMEDRNFTPWLAENLDLLGEALGMNLQLEEQEVPIGENLRADIIARNGNRDLVIIENQLNKSDHDHLGKIITYASGIDASVVI